MEENEVFDSSLLKETINQLIASGKRNFALDMSPLDYIYSDTINMLMALNRRVLDVTGRLSLMGPQPEVIQILKRGGIHNILRIFESETELIQSSEDMIMQTSSHRMSDVQAAKKGGPESEFDQLRSEIGSVFDSGESHVGGHPQIAQPGVAQQGYARPAQDDDFDQMFQQFEPGHGRGAPPVSPQIPTPQAPKFQPRQYTQPPSQPMPLHPSGPAQPQRPQADVPQYSGDYSSVRPETQRFTTAPVPPVPPVPPTPPSYQGPPAPQSPEDEDVFEASPKSKAPKKIKMRDDFDSFDNDFDDEFKKKSPLPAILIVLLIVALGGAGAFVIYLATTKEKPPEKLATLLEPEPQKPVQLPTTPDSAKPAVKDSVPTPEKPDEEIVAPKPVPKKPPVTTRKPRTTTRKRRTVTRKPRPPIPSPTKAANLVLISSSPSGASVFIDGKRMGTTPFTWKKPYFGSVTVTLTKIGYEDLKESFKFTGGTLKKPFTLNKAAPKPPRAPVPSTPVVKRPVTKPPVAVKTPPKPPKTDFDEDEDPFAGEDFGDEDEDPFDDVPAPSTATKPPIQSRPPPPPVKPPTPAPGGGQASIFIASIPPVADVYIGDRLIGKTNVSELKIPAGVQTLKFVKGAKQFTKQFTLKPGKNPSQMVRIP